MENVIETQQDHTIFRINQFTKFYDCLMEDAPEGYNPWFFPCEKNNKNPCTGAIYRLNAESKGSWHDESARLTKSQCIDHIKQGYNIGISARIGDPLIIIDIDEEEYLDQLPKGTLTSTSRKRAGYHAFCWDKDGSAKINLPTDAGEVRSQNQYVLAAGSYTPFNVTNKKEEEKYNNLPTWAREDKLLGYYTIRDEVSPKEISFEELPKFFKNKEEENVEQETNILQREEKNSYSNKEGKYSELFKLKVSDIIGLIPANKRTGHPLHESDTDANWSLSKDGSIGHCWRHLVSLNAVQYLCVKARYSKCEDAGTPHKGRGISKIRGDKEAFKVAYGEAVKLGLIKEFKPEQEIKNSPYLVFEKEGQALEFIKRQPLFFDKSCIWWLWNFEDSKYEMTDKTQILTNIKNSIGANVINSKERTEIINALEIVGREHLPEEIPAQCIQFKDRIINIKTEEEFESSPKYFATNPLPWKIGDSEETPTMDRYFKEWVGEEYVQTLYEILAYSACSDQFMQRMIALVGGGSNGKGTFIKLLKKFIGKDNCTSSELEVLSSNIFETSALYKKLVCEMGEVNHDDLKNSNQIKKLSGQDDIRYCFKGKTPFTAESPTTCLINTNSLPISRDKTAGFYRRWLIIDFPNQFPIKEGLIEAISDEEFENLARKSISILKEMYKNYKFTNEGDIEERAKKYEERSNPVMRFVEDNCLEDYEEYIPLKEFSRHFNDYLKSKHLRSQTPKEIKRSLVDDGFDVRKTTRFGIQDMYIMNLNLKNPLNLKNVTSTLHGNLVEKNGINGINGFKYKDSTNTQETLQ